MKHIFITALMTAGITLNATAVIGPGAKEAAHARMDRVMRESGNIFKDRRHDTPFLQKGVRQAPAKMVNVDFSMADDEEYSLELAVAIDKNTGSCEYYADGNNWGLATIPAGEYDFLFWGTSNEEPYYYCMYGDENVILNEDRDYVLDFSKCTSMVKFESTLPLSLITV
ncbi:MAG: hypothetical protein K2H75_07475 [Muribaculaceae bacterium]|nr:hypothetical protein [Muribaculaceae bacterium]